MQYIPLLHFYKFFTGTSSIWFIRTVSEMPQLHRGLLSPNRNDLSCSYRQCCQHAPWFFEWQVMWNHLALFKRCFCTLGGTIFFAEHEGEYGFMDTAVVWWQISSSALDSGRWATCAEDGEHVVWVCAIYHTYASR